MEKSDFDLTDESIMQFGKHKGRKLRDVPASYLLWILNTWDEVPFRLHQYLVENQDALLMQARDQSEEFFDDH